MQSKRLSSILMGSMTAAALIMTGCGGSDDSSSSTTTTTTTTYSSISLATATAADATVTGATTSSFDWFTKSLFADASVGADESAFTWYTNLTYPSVTGKTVVTLSGTLATQTLDVNNVYAIDGEVIVPDGVTLTIPAGTVLYGNTGQSYLAVDQGGKIEANGTAANPIIFTSKADVDANLQLDETVQGQWGGLSIFGKATTNKGLESYEAGNHTFGCDNTTVTCDDTDNSGTLNYVVLKHTGYEVETDKELNGLSLGGIGSGTTVQNIVSVSSLDDGVEVWGGKVALTNVYLYNNADDSLDWDHGWTGSATNVYIKQNLVDGTGSRGIESDNNGGGEDATPISNPTISNFTIITAEDGGQGIVNREGTAGQLSNGIVIANNPSKAAVEVRSAATVTQGLSYTNMVLASAGGKFYAGHDEDTTDKIIGDTTAAEVEALFTTVTTSTTTNTKTGVIELPEAVAANVVTLSGSLATQTLDATKIYEIDGEVIVPDGVTLTIPAGTVLYGKTGQSYLAVDQGGKIEADGTAAAPILFTSKADFDAKFALTDTIQGQWGGLSIFGKATTNKGLESYEAGNHTFGCDNTTVTCDDTDNSGTLDHIILKHTGYEVETDKELNGLSLGGIGSGTTLSNIVSISSLDDGIELWGGKAAITNLYLYNNADDSLDWDHGWTGSATNVYIEQNLVDGTGSRGIESDNNGGGEDATPISNPTITNFTIITAEDGGQGIVNREGTAGDLSNGIVIANNPEKAAIEIRSAATLTQGLAYDNMILANPAAKYYAGHDEDTTDKIIGDTTAAEVQALVETGHVTTTKGSN